MFSESLNYLLFTNPVSQGCINAVSATTRALTKGISSGTPKQVTDSVKMVTGPPATAAALWKILGHNTVWVRLAGLSGASAVALGAWGAHRTFPSDDKRDLKAVFDSANRIHFYHTMAMLAVPFAHRPMITGPLMLLGTTLFCATCYYNALSADKTYNRLAPIGGVTLIVAWLTFLL